MFAASKTDSVSGSAPDPQFNCVTMLLHGDGTNGAQNNTFLDSSPNTFTITRNGNTSQGSFSPYGSNWGVYFGGVGNYLTTATSASGFSFGTGDFTVEFWINSNQTTRCDPVGQNNGFTSSGWWGFVFNRSSNNTMEWFENTNPRIAATSVTWNNGQWNHVAVTRSGNNVKMFLNGTQVGSTYTTSFTYGASSVGIINGVISEGKTDGPLTGYLSNVRIVKGTAVYTSSFTPSTTPLTQISGTSLLINQSNRFIDNSTNPLAITTTGSPSVQRFNPFGTATAYSTSVIGGSAYFDGSGDSLVTPTSSNLNVGTGAFQIDFWMYSLAIPAQFVGPFSANNAGGNGGIFFAYRSGNLDFTNNYDTAGVISAPYPALNQWHHIALVRNSSNVRSYYIDGVRVGTLSNSVDFNQTEITVGHVSWKGYISNFRTIVGSNVADPNSSTITIPTAPTTAVSNTQLLTNFINGAIFDNAMMNDLETVGNAQISTSVKKYGTGSLYFDGTGDWLKAPNSELYTFGTGDFTVEFWVYMTVSANNAMIGKGGINWGGADVQGWSINYSDGSIVSSGMQAVVRGGSSQASINFGALSTNTWTHIAVTRSSGTLRGFVGGVLGDSQSNSNDPTNSRALTIGADFNNAFPFTGYIDDLRITKGYARYTATFTPPTAAFPNIGPT